MFKKIFLSLAFLLIAVALGAQSLSVESFRLLDNDLTANTAGAMKRDQNGDVAALIRIVTTETGFTFEVGSMGIVATENKNGEVWVYVPAGIQRISIMHSQLGVLRDWYFPIKIEKGRTYEMRLITGVVHSYVEDRPNGQFVTFSVKPDNASVTVDDSQPRALGADGTLSLMLPYGSHTYRIEAPGYVAENGTVQVGSEKIKKEITLKSSKGTITLTCSMPNAKLYLDGEYVGDGTWTGQREPAQMYLVEAKLEGHRARSITFALDVQEQKTISVPAPQPIFGTLSIMSTPNEATILLDGKEIGQTPLLADNLLVGEHELELRKKDYRSYRSTVTVQEGKMIPVEITMSDSFTATIDSRPSGASVEIDGRTVGNTPFRMDMSSGDYRVRLTKSGFEPIDKTVHLNAQKADHFFLMSKRKLENKNLYFGGGYQLGTTNGIFGELGIYHKHLNMELGINYPSSDGTILYWLPSQGVECKTCNSSCYPGIVSSLRLGYGICLSNAIRITPQIGINYQSVKCYDEDVTYRVSGTCSLRMEYSPVRHLSIVVTPVYGTSLRDGDIARRINENTGILDDWYDGLMTRFGVEFYF